MRLTSLPGFSAETSIGRTGAGTYRTSGRSYAAAPTAIMTQAPGDPGGWAVDFGGNPNQRACARCKSGCFHQNPAKRQACLAMCAETVC